MKPEIRQRLRYGEVPCRFRDPGLPIALEGRVECKHRRLRLFALDPAAGTGSNIEVRLCNMVVRGEGSGSADDGFPIRLFYKKSARRGGGTDESRETEIERGGAAAPDEDEVDTTMYPVEFFFDSAELRNDVLAVVQNRIANPVSTKNLSQQVIERLGLFGGHPSTKERAEEDADEVEFGGGSADNSPLKTSKGNNKYQYGGSAASSTKSNRTIASWCLPGGAGDRGTQARRNTYTNAGSGGASTRNKSAGAASGGRYYGSLLKNRISDFVSIRGSGRTPGGAAVGRIEDGKENDRLPPKSLEQQKLETYLLHDCEAAPATTSGDTGTRTVQHHQLVDDLLHEYAAKPSLLRDYFEYQYGVGGMREEQFGWFLVQTQDESADAARDVFDKLKPPWTQISSTFSSGDQGAPVVGGAGFAGGDYSHVSGGARASSYNEQTGKGGRALISTGGAGAGGSFSMMSTGLVSSLNAYGFRRFLCDPVRNCIACRDPAENIGGQGGERGGSSVPLPPDLPLDSFLVAGCYLDGNKPLFKTSKSAPSSTEGREIVTWSREALAALVRLFRALTFLVVETETDEDVGVFSTSGRSKVAPSRSGAEERGASSSSSPHLTTCSDAVQIFEQLTEICETEDPNPFPLRVTFLTPQRKAAAALREAISRSSCLAHAATLLGEDINDERRLPTVMQIRARILLDVISNEQPPSSAWRFLPPDPLPDSRTKRSDEAPPTVASAAAPRHANSGGSLAVVDMDKTPATSSTDLTKYWGRGISRVCTRLWLPDCTIFGARGYAAQQHAQPLRPWRVTIRPILVEKAFPLHDSDSVLRKVLRGVLDDELQAVHEQLFAARAMGEKQYLLGNPLLDASASRSTNATRSATAAVAKLSDKLSSSTWINRGALLANDNSMYASSTTEQDEAAGRGAPLAANKLKESSLSLHVSVRSFALREHQSWFAPVTAQTTTNLFSRTAAVEALLLSKMKLQGGGGKGKKEDNYGRNNNSTKKQFVQADPTGAKGRSRQSSNLPDPEAFFIEAAEQGAETVRGGGAARDYRENKRSTNTFVKSSGSDVFVSFVIPHPESGICTLELQTRNELTGRTAIVGSFCFPLRTLRPGLRWVPFVRNARLRGMLAFVSLSS